VGIPLDEYLIAGAHYFTVRRLTTAFWGLGFLAVILAGSVFGCGEYDPVDPLGMQKNFNPAYKAAYEANEKAPHVYDRAPTAAEKEEVQAACENYVRQQQMATVGNVIFSVANPASTPYVPPTVEQCESEHFNPIARDSAKQLHNAMPGYTVAPY